MTNPLPHTLQMMEDALYSGSFKQAASAFDLWMLLFLLVMVVVTCNRDGVTVLPDSKLQRTCNRKHRTCSVRATNPFVDAEILNSTWIL